MKQLRPVLFGLSILLTGCSTLSHFSWSSLSPFNWFGTSATVGDGGVGKVTAATPLTESALSDALDGDYSLRSGMQTNNGDIVAFYQAVKDKRVMLTFYGPAAGSVRRIEVLDPAIASQWGVKIGADFSSLYSKAYGACQRGEGDDSDAVVCAAPQSAHVSYVFTGPWHGPQELMPSDDTLKQWRISKILWHADPSR